MIWYEWKLEKNSYLFYLLFSAIIVTIVKVTAFLDFCLRYKRFYWSNMKVRVWWPSELFSFLVGHHNSVKNMQARNQKEQK